MISDQAADLIEAVLRNAAVSWKTGEARRIHADALAEFQQDRAERKDAAATIDVPDPDAARHVADAALVDAAVRKHTRAGLVHCDADTRPTDGDLFPSVRFAQAQWHLTRAQLLEIAPVDVAAAQLREEAIRALDTNPKERP